MDRKISDEDYSPVERENQSLKENYPEIMNVEKAEEEKDSNTDTFLSLFIESNMGGINFLMVVIYLTVSSIYAGHLPKSTEKVEAMGVGSVWQGLACFVFWGQNAGFGVLAARCEGLKDYPMFHRFFKKYLISHWVCFFFQHLYTYIIYFFFGYFYSEDPTLRYYLRCYLVLSLFHYVLNYYSDLCRQLFQARFFFYQCFFVEVAISLGSIGFTYIFVEVMKLDFYGVIFGSIATEAACLILYLGLFIFGSKWEDYWDIIKRDENQRAYLNLLEEETISHRGPVEYTGEPQGYHHENNSKVSKEVDNLAKDMILRRKMSSRSGVDKEIEQSESELETLYGFIKFNAIYASSFFLDGFWWQFDTIVATFLYPHDQVSAQSSFNAVLLVPFNLYYYGYSMMLSVKISQYMVEGRAKEAKKVVGIYFFQIISISAVFGFILFYFGPEISIWIQADPDTSKIITRIMRLYSFAFPFAFLSEMVFAVCRSVNKQNEFFWCQIISNYLVNFGAIAFNYWYLHLDIMGIWWAYLLAKVAMTIVGFLLILTTDFEKESKNIIHQMTGNIETENDKMLGGVN